MITWCKIQVIINPFLGGCIQAGGGGFPGPESWQQGQDACTAHQAQAGEDISVVVGKLLTEIIGAFS